VSTTPPIWDPPEDADEQYRRASALDPSRPSEATRRAVLAHAAALAAERARRDADRPGRFWREVASRMRWQPALAGTLAAAILAALLIAPQFLVPRPPRSTQPPTPVSPPSALATAPTPAARHPLAEQAPPQPSTAPASPVASNALPRNARPASSGAHPAAKVSAAPVPPAETAAESRSLAPVPAAGGAVAGLQAEEARNLSAAADAAAVAAPPPPPAAQHSLIDPAALRQAAGAGDLAQLEAQLAKGAAIDSRDPLGRTALMLATLRGQAGAVALLLARGADPNAADARGTTPLQAAVEGKEPEIAAMLRHYGAR
jgi:ankyrin repeat protein